MTELERVLVVGLGSIGTRHARILRQHLPRVRLIALRRPGSVAAAPGIVDETVTDLADALRAQPQAAVIANPASEHLAVALPLAEAGVHLLVEKPLAASTAGVQRLLEVCAARAVTLMVGYNMRFLTSLRYLHDLVRQQSLGRPLFATAHAGQDLPTWRPDSDYRRGVSARAELGGGALLELSHELDYLRWLFGEVAWVSAVATRQSDLDVDVEDTALLTLGFCGTAPDTPLIASVTLDFIRRDRVRECTVVCDSGSLRWNGLAGTVEVFESGAADWRTCFTAEQHADDSYAAEWEHFAACVAESRRPLIAGSDGAAVLRVIEAARRSSAARCVVRVDGMGDGAAGSQP